MVALSMLWVPFIKYLSSEVYIYLQSVQAYISPPIAAVFLVGVFWPRANRYGAFSSLIVGAILGAARFLFELNRGSSLVTSSPFLTTLVSINFLHFAVVLFVVSLFVLIGVSLATAPRVHGQAARPDVRDAGSRLPARRRCRPDRVHPAGRRHRRPRTVHHRAVGALCVMAEC